MQLLKNVMLLFKEAKTILIINIISFKGDIYLGCKVLAW